MAIELPKTQTPQTSSSIVSIDTSHQRRAAEAMNKIGQEIQTTALDEIKQESIRKADQEWSKYVTYDEKGRLIPPAEPPGLPGTTSHKRYQDNIRTNYVQSLGADAIANMREITSRVGTDPTKFNNEYDQYAKTTSNNVPAWLRGAADVELQKAKAWGLSEINQNINVGNAKAQVDGVARSSAKILAEARRDQGPLEPHEENLRKVAASQTHLTPAQQNEYAEANIMALRANRAIDAYQVGQSADDRQKYARTAGAQSDKMQDFIQNGIERKENVYNGEIEKGKRQVAEIQRRHAEHYKGIVTDELRAAGLDVDWNNPEHRRKLLEGGAREKIFAKALGDTNLDEDTRYGILGWVRQVFNGLSEEDERTYQKVVEKDRLRLNAAAARVANDIGTPAELGDDVRTIAEAAQGRPTTREGQQRQILALDAYRVAMGHVQSEAVTRTNAEDIRRSLANEPYMTMPERIAYATAQSVSGTLSMGSQVQIYEGFNKFQSMDRQQRAQSESAFNDKAQQVALQATNASESRDWDTLGRKMAELNMISSSPENGPWSTSARKLAGDTIKSIEAIDRKQDIAGAEAWFLAEKREGKKDPVDFAMQAYAMHKMGVFTQEKAIGHVEDYNRTHARTQEIYSAKLSGGMPRAGQFDAAELERIHGKTPIWDPRNPNAMVEWVLRTGILPDDFRNAMHGIGDMIAPQPDKQQHPDLEGSVAAWKGITYNLDAKSVRPFLAQFGIKDRNALNQLSSTDGKGIEAVRIAFAKEGKPIDWSRLDQIPELKNTETMNQGFREVMRAMDPNMDRSTMARNAVNIFTMRGADNFERATRTGIKDFLDKGGKAIVDMNDFDGDGQDMIRALYAEAYQDVSYMEPGKARALAWQQVSLAIGERASWYETGSGKKATFDHFVNKVIANSGNKIDVTDKTVRDTAAALLTVMPGIGPMSGKVIDGKKLEFVYNKGSGLHDVYIQDPNNTLQPRTLLMEGITTDFLSMGISTAYITAANSYRAGESRGTTGDRIRFAMAKGADSIAVILGNQAVANSYFGPAREWFRREQQSGRTNNLLESLAAQRPEESFFESMKQNGVLPRDDELAVKQAQEFFYKVQDVNVRLQFVGSSREQRDRMYQRVIIGQQRAFPGQGEN